MATKRSDSKGKNEPKQKQTSSNQKQNELAKTDTNGTEIEKVTLFRNPIRTLHLFSKVVGGFLGTIGQFVVKHSIWFGLLAAALVIPHIVHGPHTPIVRKIDQFIEFALYWIILGVASSIGLGTGLHTFVLYLGPHIAKVTMVANECNVIPEYLPSRWAIKPTFGPCPEGDRPEISFLTILLAVQIESFLWGLGTALGELPPYFVARAASVAGNKPEELEELDKGGANSLVDKAKLIIYKGLKRYGFLTVLLCASIPNPLFDLAGITCGHFGIPFKTFFSATAIGKAIIKVHIQMIFVIFMFSGHHVDSVLKFVERHVPFLSNSLTNALEKQKKLLHSPPDAIKDDKPLIAQAWDWVIFLMIAFFIKSTIESLANSYLEEEEAKKKEGQDKKKE